MPAMTKSLHSLRVTALVLAISACTQLTLAQTTPDAGSLLREAERKPQRLPNPVPQAVPKAPAGPEMGSVRVQVKAFRITGNTLISEPDLQAVLLPWVGKETSFAELQQATNAVAEAYRARGWFARPQLPAQDVNDGVVTIHIIEGRLGAVRLDDGGKTLRTDRAMVTDTMTARQKSGEPLNLNALDRSTNILNDTPGVAVATILAPGKNTGDTDAVVKVQDKPLFSGTAMLDNQGARSTGADKISVSLMMDSPRGIGDQIALNGNTSEGSQYLKLAYALPWGRDGARVGASTSAMRYTLMGELASLNAKGDAQTFGVNASYPLLRSGTKNIAFAAALDRKTYYNEASQVATSQKVADVALLAFSGDLLDGIGQGGMTLWGINLTAGQINLSGNATNQGADRSGAKTEGSYHKLGYNLARLQRLSDKTSLWASFSGQSAGKNLDSSEKFSLGGASGVRAYPLSEGSGDTGWLTTLEVRHNLLPELQVSVFYDHGQITLNHDNAYTGAPLVNEASLKGYGVGLSWTQSGNFSVRASLAHRVDDNPLASAINGKDGDGSLTLDRLWFTATKFF
jgi:hemolysin activation/secretion protein